MTQEQWDKIRPNNFVFVLKKLDGTVELPFDSLRDPSTDPPPKILTEEQFETLQRLQPRTIWFSMQEQEDDSAFESGKDLKNVGN